MIYEQEDFNRGNKNKTYGSIPILISIIAFIIAFIVGKFEVLMVVYIAVAEDYLGIPLLGMGRCYGGDWLMYYDRMTEDECDRRDGVYKKARPEVALLLFIALIITFITKGMFEGCILIVVTASIWLFFRNFNDQMGHMDYFN
jgi:hypothetical protein